MTNNKLETLTNELADQNCTKPEDIEITEIAGGFIYFTEYGKPGWYAILTKTGHVKKHSIKMFDPDC